MTVLSDAEIRACIARNELVPGGDPAKAEECSYSFRPGRAFLAGDGDSQVDFLGSGSPRHLTVKPGKMVWIRTRDRVQIPHGMVGFWWQTNSLSRKGLMLVNMSMVEPGYTGDLACLFVNFGDRRIIIEAETVIAKMVFVDVRGAVAHPFSDGTTTERYDATLRELAANQPSSFLQIGDLAPNLERQRIDAMAAIKAAGDSARAAAEKAASEARDQAISDFKKDVPKALLGTSGMALGAIALLAAATVAADWAKGNLFPDTKKVARAEAEEALRERVTIAATPNAPETAELLRRVGELNARLEKLEKKKP